MYYVYLARILILCDLSSTIKDLTLLVCGCCLYDLTLSLQFVIDTLHFIYMGVHRDLTKKFALQYHIIDMLA